MNAQGAASCRWRDPAGADAHGRATRLRHYVSSGVSFAAAPTLHALAACKQPARSRGKGIVRGRFGALAHSLDARRGADRYLTAPSKSPFASIPEECLMNARNMAVCTIGGFVLAAIVF